MNGARLAILLSGNDPDASLWRAAVLANGGSVGPRTLKAVSTFARQAKGLGLWSKLTRVNLVCGDQLAAAQVPLKIGGGNATETLTNIVAGDYVETGATAGIKGNGTNKSADTGWNPVGQSASSSSAGLWAYVKGTESDAATRVIIGAAGVGNANLTALGWVAAGTKEAGGIAMANGTEYAPSEASAAKEGFLGVTANGSRSNQFYQNGAAVGSAVTGTGSFFDASLRLLAISTNGVLGSWSTRYLRAYAITTGLSAADAANLNTIMQTFQSALSRNV